MLMWHYVEQWHCGQLSCCEQRCHCVKWWCCGLMSSCERLPNMISALRYWNSRHLLTLYGTAVVSVKADTVAFAKCLKYMISWAFELWRIQQILKRCKWIAYGSWHSEHESSDVYTITRTGPHVRQNQHATNHTLQAHFWAFQTLNHNCSFTSRRWFMVAWTSR